MEAMATETFDRTKSMSVRQQNPTPKAAPRRVVPPRIRGFFESRRMGSVIVTSVKVFDVLGSWLTLKARVLLSFANHRRLHCLAERH